MLYLFCILEYSFLFGQRLKVNHKERKGVRILSFCLYFCISMPTHPVEVLPVVPTTRVCSLTQLPLVSVSPQPPCFPLIFFHLLLPLLLVQEEAPRANADVAVQVHHPSPSALVAVTARTTETSCSVTSTVFPLLAPSFFQQDLCFLLISSSWFLCGSSYTAYAHP